MLTIQSSYFHTQMQEYIHYLVSFYDNNAKIYEFKEPYLKKEFLNELLQMSTEQLYECYCMEENEALKKIYEAFAYYQLNQNTCHDIQMKLAILLLASNRATIEHWVDYLSEEVLHEFYTIEHVDILNKIFAEVLSEKKLDLLKNCIAQETNINKKVEMMLIVERKESNYLNSILQHWSNITAPSVFTPATRYLEDKFFQGNMSQKRDILNEISSQKPQLSLKFSILDSFKLKKIEDILIKELNQETRELMLNMMNITLKDIQEMVHRHISNISLNKQTGVFSISNNFCIILNFVKNHYKEEFIKSAETLTNAWCNHDEQKYKALIYWLEHGEFSKSATHTDFFKQKLKHYYPDVDFSEKNTLTASLKNLGIENPINEVKKHLLERLNNKPVQEEITILM